MIRTYIQILNLLYAPNITDRVVLHIFRFRLLDYTTNAVHDRIFDLLFDYLGTNKINLIKSVRALCKEQIREYDEQNY